MDMKVGDLLHIPQAVVLWNIDIKNQSISKIFTQTEKPYTGIYLGTAIDQKHLINVFVKGQQRLVNSKEVYLLGE
jgi:hypothetical protein